MFTNGDKSLTKENIFKYVDSYSLFKYYCKGFKEINKKFSSEFRKDKDPSCSIIVWKGDLLYKDFGEKGYRVLDYIARKFNLSYTEVLQKINKDFNLQLGCSSNEPLIFTPKIIKSEVDISKFEKKDTIIEIISRSWTRLDKEYWNSYGIPLKLLEYHNIKSISHYFITNEKKNRALYAVNPYMLAYSIDYYTNNDIFRRKLYFPKVKNNRFISNVDSTIVQGWTLLPKKGKILFITKSYKDILIFNLLGYWAIAPNNEGAYIPEKVMEKLKERWENIYVWFDNDEGGIRGGTSFANKFDLPFTYNPLGEPKDPSDYVKRYSLNQFDKLITNFLEKWRYQIERKNDTIVRL